MTICTQNRICWFGDVIHEKMELSDIGEIAQSEWLKTFEMRPQHEFMDGRICGDVQSFTCHYRNWGIMNIIRDPIRNVQMQCIASVRTPTPQRMRITTDPKINLFPNPKIWHPLFGDLKLGLPKMCDKSIPIIHGNLGIMTISYETNHRIEGYRNTSRTILYNGLKIHFIHHYKNNRT